MAKSKKDSGWVDCRWGDRWGQFRTARFRKRPLHGWRVTLLLRGNVCGASGTVHSPFDVVRASKSGCATSEKAPASESGRYNGKERESSEWFGLCPSAAVVAPITQRADKIVCAIRD